MNCYIRVDGNPRIGMGHVSRCLSIAVELKQMGGNPSFIIGTEHPRELIESFCFSCIKVSDVVAYSDEEKTKIAEIVKDKEAIILVDNYNADDRYLAQLERIAPTFYIDGKYGCQANISGVINYNAAADIEEYKKKFKNTETALLIGTRYAPVKRQFLDAREKRVKIQATRVEKAPLNILVTTGSTDQYKFIYNFCKRIIHDKKFEGRRYHIVLGKLYGNIDEIKELLQPYENFVIYYNVPDMYNLMAKSDVAISAAGTTIYELLCVGVPTITFGTVDVHSTFSALSPNIIWAGNVQDKCSEGIETIIQHVTFELDNLIRNPEQLNSLNSSATNLVDGKGAQRIASELLRIALERSICKKNA